MHELTRMIKDDMVTALGVTEPGAIAHALFMIDIITCAGRSMNHSFNLGLYSPGHAFWPMIISIVSIWVVQVGCGFLHTVPAGLGVVGQIHDILTGGEEHPRHLKERQVVFGRSSLFFIPNVI